MLARWLIRGCAVLTAAAFTYACSSKRSEDVEPRRAAQALDVSLSFTFPVEQSLFRTVLYGDSGLRIADGTVIRPQQRTAEVGSAAGLLELGADTLLGETSSQHVLSAFSGGDTFLRERARVTGFVRGARPVQRQNGVFVALGSTSDAVFTPPRSFVIEATFPTPTASVRLEPDRSLTLAPGAFTDLYVASRSTLRLSAGRYSFASVQIEPQATLDIDDSTSEVLLFVGGGFRFSGTVALRKGPENFAVVVSGSDAVALERPFRGTIVAPRSAVRLAPVGTQGYEGSFFAERMDVEARTAVRGRTFQGWAGLLCEKAEGPSLAAAMALPSTCTAYSGCCGGSMREVTLTSGPDRYDVGEQGACVIASDGADTITGCKMAGSVVLGGAGNDNLQLGQGVVAYGGEGDDHIESFGNATLFGNAGDDVLIAQAGRNIIFPGPGKDYVQTGSGDDTVVLLDACEATAGKVFDLGEGHDTVISPLTRAELEARGVTLIGVEEFRIEGDPCRSECRAAPKCVAGGTCTVQESVVQTQMNFACDINNTPRSWVSNRVIAQARESFYTALTFLTPRPSFDCTSTPLRTRTLPIPPVDGMPPRSIRIRVEGLMTDGTPIFGDTYRTLSFDQKGIPLVRGANFDQQPTLLYRRVADDVAFNFYAQARLLEDGETVQVRYQAEFYEDEPDCEMDTSPFSVLEEGTQCAGRGDPSKWDIVILNSETPVPAPIPLNLSNCWNEDCEDSAVGSISMELTW